MSEEFQEDVATEETEVETPVVEEQQDSGEETQVAAEEQNEPDDQEKNWRSANETMKEQSSQIKELKAELERLRQGAPQQQQLPKGFFDGRDKDDIPTIGEIEAYQAARESELRAQIAELSVKSRYPNMDEVINKYGKSLPDSVKYAVLKSDNPHLAAYEACINSAEYYKDGLSTTQSDKASRIEKNMKKPMSQGSVGKTGTLSKASYYEQLDDAKLLAMSQRYISGG